MLHIYKKCPLCNSPTYIDLDTKTKMWEGGCLNAQCGLDKFIRKSKDKVIKILSTLCGE